MKNRLFLVVKTFFPILVLLVVCPQQSVAQTPRIVAGPIFCPKADTTAIWFMAAHSDSVYYKIWDPKAAESRMSRFYGTKVNDTLWVFRNEFDFYEIKSDNEILFSVNGSHEGADWRELAFAQPLEVDSSDFSFLFGSCAWPMRKNDKKWEIFTVMKDTSSDFMLWMGDNVYLFKEEWESRQRTLNKYIRYRLQPQLNEFLKSRPQYATWDDHDFGPNDSDSQVYQETITREVFQEFWPNPSYGTVDCSGVFFSFKKADAEFFVLDSRSHKRKGEALYGPCQMEWLKAGLRASTARVKFVVGGSQFIAESWAEDWADSPIEKADFFDFIKNEKIRGIVFLSGDRHFTEMSEMRLGDIRLIDITVSPLTSFVYPFPVAKNDYRVPGTWKKKRNFGKISLTGKGTDRRLLIEVRDRKGRMIWEREVLLGEF